jgi:2-polyprenyl-3-methyl-5-hydroxy-6-metoxy-1,4-benzoquinol methylase
MPGDYATKGQKETAAQLLKELRPRLPHLRQTVKRHFPTDHDAAILDLGCGSGELVYVAREMGYNHVRGVDVSFEHVAAARDFGINSIQQADAMEALEKEGGSSLDCVICFDFLEHVAKNKLIPLAGSVHRVLRAEGRWIVHVPNAESPFGMRIRYGDLNHELAFTRVSLSRLLLSSGFSQVNCYEDAPVIHGLKSAGRFLLWKCFRSLLRLYLAAETGDLGREAIFSQNFTAVAGKR